MSIWSTATPQYVSGLSGVVQVTAGNAFSCARTNDGTSGAGAATTTGIRRQRVQPLLASAPASAKCHGRDVGCFEKAPQSAGYHHVGFSSEVSIGRGGDFRRQLSLVRSQGQRHRRLLGPYSETVANSGMTTLSGYDAVCGVTTAGGTNCLFFNDYGEHGAPGGYTTTPRASIGFGGY